MMKNLLGGAPILSSTSRKQVINDAIDTICGYISFEYWCVVDLNGDDCYLLKNSKEDFPVFAIIIDGNLSPFEKLINLTHQLGHVVSDTEKDIILNELNAWCIGFSYVRSVGVYIDPTAYMAKMQKSIGKHIRVLNKT